MNDYYKNLCGYANLFTKDPTKSEDIVQNVFVKLWVYRKNIDSNIPIKRYLQKSVYNEFIDQYRKNKSVISMEEKHLKAINIILDDDSLNVEKTFKHRFLFMLENDSEYKIVLVSNQFPW